MLKGNKRRTMKPKVSVIMPVYNAENYVKETIEGILNQTFRDFELLIINDHPTDGTMDIVRSIRDDRIRIIENDKNRGIAYSRNKGLEEARGSYIALMDDDDLTDKARFELEVNYLDSHPEIDVIGGGSINIDESNRRQTQSIFMVTSPNDIRVQMMFFCPMANGSTMFRKSIIDTYGIRYQEKCLGMEDYRFWIEVSLHAQIVNLQKTLLYWRVSRNAETTRVTENKKEERKKLFAKFQIYALEANGFRLTESEKQIFTEAFEESKSIIYQNVDQLQRVLRKLVKQAYDLELPFAGEMRLICRNYYVEMLRRNGIVCKKGLKKKGFACEIITAPVKVSVIIPTFNRADRLAYSVNSVLEQSYEIYEILIIDDGSSDNTKEIVERLQDKHPNKIYYYRLEQNGGPAKARNFGVQHAKGEYIAFHDDDDEWHPDKLEIQMGKMLNDLSIDMTFGQMIRYNDGQFINIVCEQFDWYHIQEHFYQKILLENYIGAPTIVVKKESFIKLGGFCEDISSLEDWEFAIRAARELHIEFINTPLMDVHVTQKSVSHNVDNYVDSWTYIFQKYLSETEDRGMFIFQMLRHLAGAMFEQDFLVKRRYADQARQMIFPNIIPQGTYEEKLFDMFFQLENVHEHISQMRKTVDNLARYKKVSAKLLDTENTISQWLFEKGITKVAIYGMGKLGKCLADRLENGKVKVVCGIDQKQLDFRNIPVVSIEQFCEEYYEVDAIIVTPLYEFQDIVKKISDSDKKKRKYYCISIENILE